MTNRETEWNENRKEITSFYLPSTQWAAVMTHLELIITAPQ